MPATITTLLNQNLLDLTLISCGSLESAMAFVTANSKGITDSIAIGDTFSIPNVITNNPTVVQYLQQNGIVIGTQD